jgi:hypothetical protein
MSSNPPHSLSPLIFFYSYEVQFGHMRAIFANFVNLKNVVLWDVTPVALEKTDVSEERIASIIR